MLPSGGGGEKNLKITIQMLLNSGGAKQAQALLDQIGTSSKKAGREVGQVKSSFSGLAKEIGSMGPKVTAIGAAITGSLLVAVKSYVDSAKFTNATAAAWADQTRSLESSYRKIGGVAAEQVLPTMEKIAQLAETAAKFAQDHPDVIKAALAVGAGLTGVGALMTGGAAAGGAIGSVVPGAGTAAGATVGGLAGLLGGVSFLAGTGMTGLIEKLLPNLWANLSVGKENRPSLTEALTGVSETSGAGLSGMIDRLTESYRKQESQIQSQPEVMQAYISYQRQETQAENQYRTQRTKAVRDFLRTEALAYEDYYRTQSLAIRDFQRSETLATEDYYRQQRISARDFNISMARSEQDRQKSVRRASEDHAYRLFQIIRDGDAMAYWQEQYSFNKEQARATEDYETERSREAEDFAIQQADAAEEFKIQRERAEDEFEIKLQDQADEFRIQRQRAAEQFEISQSDAEYQFEYERAVRQQNFVWSLSQFANEETQIANLRAQYTAASLQQMQSMWSQYLSGQPITIPQLGFSYSAAGASQAGGVSSGYVVQQNNTFTSGVSAEDVLAIQGSVQNMLTYALGGQ